MFQKLILLSSMSLLACNLANAQIQLSPQAPKPPVAQAPKPPPTIAPKGQAPAAPSEPVQTDEVVIAPTKQKIANPTAVFTGLDKITGRIVTFDVSINETVQFGALQITPRVCYTRPQTEAPLTTSFLDVSEQSPSGELRKVFTGWIYASSPGLSGVEHPVYDVWLSNCSRTAVKAVVVPQK
jgi:hypothetical protein